MRQKTRITQLLDGPRLASKPDIMKLPALVERIRGEFREMPGLQLTPAQASRFLGIEPAACRTVLEALVAAAFLRWTPVGTIARHDG
jgi:hypothetical protein